MSLRHPSGASLQPRFERSSNGRVGRTVLGNPIDPGIGHSDAGTPDMPRPSKRRGLVIACGFVALLLVTAVGWKGGPRRVENAVLVEWNTNIPGTRSAVFLILNPSTKTLQLGPMFFRRAGSSGETETRRVGRIRGDPLLNQPIPPNEGKRVELTQPPRDGEWILEGILVDVADGFAARTSGWLTRTVNAVAPKGAISGRIGRGIQSFFGMIYEVRSAPFRPDQLGTQAAAAGAAP